VSVDRRAPRAAPLGICYADSRIRIRLHSLRSVDLLILGHIDTLCHELAHLRRFNRPPLLGACRRILAYARRHGSTGRG
jgi:hypothetical protein